MKKHIGEIAEELSREIGISTARVLASGLDFVKLYRKCNKEGMVLVFMPELEAIKRKISFVDIKELNGYADENAETKFGDMIK